MQFHLKTREAPLFAAVNTPEKQPDHLFRSLGFNRTGRNGSARKMHEHTPPRGDMIAVGHSECEQYFVLFNIVLCSSMFFDVHRQG